jgi:hypothetical protein
VAAITLRLDLPAHFLDVGAQRAGSVLLAACLASFMFIRASARLMRSPRVPSWPGSVTTSSGLHLHHPVWGTVLILSSGFLAFVTPDASPTTEILAGVFGVGAGLTLDEFALLIHLRDVYWGEEGRASLDAVDPKRAGTCRRTAAPPRSAGGPRPGPRRVMNRGRQ